MDKVKSKDETGIQAAIDKLREFEQETPNASQLILQDSLLTEKPLCYADFVTMTSVKHESTTYLSRLYCQKNNEGYHQLFDVPTFQFVSTPSGVEFSRILLDCAGVVTIPGVTMSTALTASVKQKKKPTDHDLATLARFSVDMAKDRLKEYKRASRESYLSFGFYCVYLHTFALVCNIPLKPVTKLTNMEAIRKDVNEIEKIVQPWIDIHLRLK